MESKFYKFFSFLILFSLVILTGTLYAQQQAITGTVKDENSKAMPGVSVVIKGTSTGTVTQANGSFKLNAPVNAIVTFKFVGYKTLEVPLNGKANIDIQLTPTSSALGEVVVVAYGTQKRSDVTGAVSDIKESQLKDQPVSQFGQQLQGKVAGVQVNQTTGIPGAGISIRVRQAASLSGGSQPLYVVDGFPIVGDINSINPDEIESFSILKDASATALYGSRAANGVVLITTKHAKAGQTNLGFNSFYGFQSVPQKGRPDMMNAEEFATYENQVFAEKIRLGQASSIPSVYLNPSQYAGQGTDWYNVILRNAAIRSYNLSLTSSGEKLSTSADIGYLDQDGVLINSNFKRYSARVNSNYKINDRLTIGLNIAPSYTTRSTPNSDGNIFNGGIIQNAITSSPLAPAINPDGSIPLTATSPGLFPNPNWYNVAQIVKNNTNVGRLLSNAFLNLDIFSGLSFKSTINIDYTNSQNQTWTPSTAGYLFSPPPITATAGNTSDIFYTWLTENTLNYKYTLGQHHFEALVGYTAQKYHEDYLSVGGYGFPNDKIPSLAAATQFYTPQVGIGEWSLVSLVSRLNYNFNNKYLLSLSYRRDGSSRFAPNTKYGNFPAVSAGWNVSEEDFMKKIPVISMLKVRAGYGLNGNFNIGNYGFSANTQTTLYAFNNTLASGTSIANLGNNNLSWEKSRQLDIGLDIGILNDRLSLSYDYFHKITSNMLLNINIPQESGYSNIATNAGKFLFYGHEFSITSQNLTGKFKWSTNLNISFIRNKVLDLGPYGVSLPRGVNDANIIQVGQPIGVFYGYKFLGIYKTQAEFNSSPKYLGSDAPSQVGTVKYADTNHDGVIDDKDRTIIGNPNPNYTFGVTNNLSYKKFDLGISLAGSVGNDIMNKTLEYTQNLDGVFNVTKDVAKRWMSEADPGDGVHPRAVVSTALARYVNSRWVSSGSYLTIKNITLGYTVPINELKYLKSIRIYSSIQQAWVFTKYNGANPEVNDAGTNALLQGIDYTSYPVPRTVSFGINMNLK